jgi:hypothetical protein
MNEGEVAKHTHFTENIQDSSRAIEKSTDNN